MLTTLKILLLGASMAMETFAQNRIEIGGEPTTVEEAPARYAGMYHEITEGRVRIHGPNGLFYETSKPLLTVSVTARRATDGYIFNVIEGPGSSVKSVRVLSRAEEPVTEQGSAGFGGHTLRIQTNALPVDLTLIVSTHDPLDIAAHTFPDDYPAEFGEYIHKIMRTLDTKHFNVQELLSR